MAKQSVYQYVAKVVPDDYQIRQLQEETGYSELFVSLCWQRGLQTKEAILSFLSPRLEALHDPFLMYDMSKAVERIKKGIEEQECILIYGDYDADGITSTTILVETIEALGGDVRFYLPNRFVDGYGPNKEVFQYMIDVDGVDLIVTCDNGVAGHEAIAFAMGRGIDVIVTDHHELPDILPNAYAIVHPRHPNGEYPFGDLSGAGVAFKVACALLEDMPYELLEVAAIGTVADLVSLTDENRILVSFGIEMMRQTQRIGLLKLLERLSIDINAVDADTIGFQIGPRLNALGRLDDATPGVDLLMTFDEDEAVELVQLLENKNNERKQIVSTIVQDVFQQLPKELPNVIVLADENWHAGVLGIVASQVVEKTGRPTILLQKDLETGLAKGSGRSVANVNLYKALSQSQAILEKFGGHDMAAGLTVQVANIDVLETQLNDLIKHIEKPVICYDLALEDSQCTLDFVKEYQQLAPFGLNNEKPVFLFEQMTVSKVKAIGNELQHLKGKMGTIDFIAFHQKEFQAYVQDGIQVTVLGQLNINEWNGLELLQCQWMDFVVNGVQLFDRRATQITALHVSVEHAVYVFSDEKYKSYFETRLPESSRAMFYADVTDELVSNYDNVVLFDCPDTLEQLYNVLSVLADKNIYLNAHVRSSAYLMGTPTREQFAKLYKVLHHKQTVAIRDNLDQLAAMINVKKDALIFMIQVFSDAKFVTIDNGQLTLTKTVEKSLLEETETYKKHHDKMKVEQLLLYTEFSQLREILLHYINKEDDK